MQINCWGKVIGWIAYDVTAAAMKWPELLTCAFLINFNVYAN